jgi:cell wall assembly regulator SMI1
MGGAEVLVMVAEWSGDHEMDKVHSMREIWDMIEGWLALNTPWIQASLAPGATQDEIQTAEASLGLALPEDVRQSYRLHNGQKAFDPLSEQKRTGFVYGDKLQTLKWITRNGHVQHAMPW